MCSCSICKTGRTFVFQIKPAFESLIRKKEEKKEPPLPKPTPSPQEAGELAESVVLEAHRTVSWKGSKLVVTGVKNLEAR